MQGTISIIRVVPCIFLWYDLSTLKAKTLIALLAIVTACAVSLLIYKDNILFDLKARGYLEYTTDEAVELAYDKCDRCHSIEKAVNYCPRCGPPFVIAIHNMKILIAKGVGNPGVKGFPTISDAEAVAITEVWNGLVGNWEEGWRKDDLIKMLQGDQALIDLLEIYPQNRPIESKLFGKKAPGAQYEGGFEFKGKIKQDKR